VSRIRDVLEELRRRRIFRVAALYVVGAWLVIQAADLAFPGLRIPESAIRFVWIGALIGFPVALIVGWRFDVIGGRIVHTAASSWHEHTSPSRTDYAVLTVLAISVAAITSSLVADIFAVRTPETEQQAHSNIDPKSIAVLPFTDMSGDESNKPFTLGIHDDVLTHVSKISDIKVISRTSVARLDTGLSVPEIGMLLGVATVLESGVQRIGNRVRINAQLIDAATDQHLWAETFDRELTTQNIFEIQSEIAAAITAELRATLSPQDQANLSKMPTPSLQAYEAYLLGKQRMTIRTRDELLSAIDYFEKALEFDSQYALAFVGLANANLLLNNYGYLPLEDALAVADSALESALQLDDELGAAYASIGLSQVQQGNISAAAEAFQRAIKLAPNDAMAYHWYGDMLLTRSARPEEALPLLQRARELDPLSPIVNVTLGEVLETVGEFDEALAQYRKAMEIEPDYPGAYYLIGMQYRTVFGKLDEAIRWHRREASIASARETSIFGWNYLDLGDDARAERWIDRANRANPNGFLPRSIKVFLHRYRGEEAEALRLARRLMDTWPGNNTSLVTLVTYGRDQEVLRELAPLYPELSCNSEITVTRLNLSQAINISLAVERTGDGECANRMLNAALKQTRRMPRRGSRGFGIADVEILARKGEIKQALYALRQAIDKGFRQTWWAQGEGSPHMTSLLENEDFKKMMNEIRSDMAKQLERVREMEANGELATVPDLP
jgi:TolB-like protein